MTLEFHLSRKKNTADNKYEFVPEREASKNWIFSASPTKETYDNLPTPRHTAVRLTDSYSYFRKLKMIHPLKYTLILQDFKSKTNAIFWVYLGNHSQFGRVWAKSFIFYLIKVNNIKERHCLSQSQLLMATRTCRFLGRHTEMACHCLPLSHFFDLSV